MVNTHMQCGPKSDTCTDRIRYVRTDGQIYLRIGYTFLNILECIYKNLIYNKFFIEIEFNNDRNCPRSLIQPSVKNSWSSKDYRTPGTLSLDNLLHGEVPGAEAGRHQAGAQHEELSHARVIKLTQRLSKSYVWYIRAISFEFVCSD